MSRSSIPFSKYHGLGNDYLVIDPTKTEEKLSVADIIRICHCHYGIGADGILYGPFDDGSGNFCVRIYNPDGSEAEKSGNGLRIFTRYLYDCGKIELEIPTRIFLPHESVQVIMLSPTVVQVEMGLVSFFSTDIGMSGENREVINETISVQGEELHFCAASVGNPHCIIPVKNCLPEQAYNWGKSIENNPQFLHRTNVQFMEIRNPNEIAIEIWERGAGYTLASGSSSTAAAAVARKLGFCTDDITVHMPGGTLNVTFDSRYNATLTGSVQKISTGEIDPEIFDNAHDVSYV